MIQRCAVGVVLAILAVVPDAAVAADLSMMPIYRSRSLATNRVVIASDPTAHADAPKCSGENHTHPACMPFDADAVSLTSGVTGRGLILYRDAGSMAAAVPGGMEKR